ncbi:MAG: TraR/DksA C4-type zinc finger protein [Planctomycetota bacterium]
MTIVSKKKTSRRKQQSKPVAKFPPTGARLLGPGATPRKPLIPSGPATRDGAADGEEQKRLKKSPLGKRDLKKFRDILIKKRNELFGDVAKLESEALRSESGSLSHTPQHLAEQGSDSYGTSLSLGLADADRRLIKEIDAALERIEAGTYGICELTGRAIRIERLTELPWARYSIDAAREQERGGPRR